MLAISGWLRRPTAYSCGGSHGFGPFWVRLTVFPFDPLAAADAGNQHESRVTPVEGSGSIAEIGMGIADGDGIEPHLHLRQQGIGRG
ncbi:hypothetical protein D9M69_686380 [compost metagenome]